MFRFALSLLGWFSASYRPRNSLGLEILAWRQQVSVLARKNAQSRLTPWDPLFWIFLRRVWSRSAEVEQVQN
jgi:hypothetical protein